MNKEADDTDLLPHTIDIHEFWNEIVSLGRIRCAKDMAMKVQQRNACKGLVGKTCSKEIAWNIYE